MRHLLLIAALAAFGASGASAMRGLPPPCEGADLSGSFSAVPGSAGAGNIVYALRLRNASHGICFVTGIPGVVLLDQHGKALPTQASPSFPGALAAIMVRLAPGKTAKATARFSPDVPGKGETVNGPCEATAYKLRVTPNGGGSLIAPLAPPTAVCEHGAMKFSALSFA
jgi:uncharacterized protein DUF4232